MKKNSGLEIIHHDIRTVQGGAVRLNNTPEQWNLVPSSSNRKINKELRPGKFGNIQNNQCQMLDSAARFLDNQS